MCNELENEVVSLFLDRHIDGDLRGAPLADGPFSSPCISISFPPGDSTARNNPTQQRDAASDRSLSIPAINGRNPDAKHTDKLLPHLISLS